MTLERQTNLIIRCKKFTHQRSHKGRQDAINIALRSLYTRDDEPDMLRTTMKRLLELAVTNVFFKRNESCYCKKEGLAMGALLSVILASPWMKSGGARLKFQT